MMKRGWLHLGGYGVVVTVFLAHAYRVYGTDVALIDDAFIFFRYAKHWAQGLGLVWNGGEQPVEGVSSLLYTALLALGIRWGWDVVMWATVLNLAVALGVLGLLGTCGGRLGLGRRSPLWTWLPGLLLAVMPDFAFWTAAGMDTLVFTGVWVVAVLSVLWERWLWAGVAFGVLGMARLDGVPLFLFTLAMVLWHHRNRRATLALVVGFVPVFLPFFLWRWNYFGWLLPNTYYAKTGGGWLALVEGGRYVIAFLRQVWLWPALGLAMLAGVRVRTWQVGYVGSAFLLLLLRAVFAGGDWMPHFRLLVPALPCLAVLSALGAYVLLERVSLSGRARVVVPTVGMLLLSLFWPSLRVVARTPWRLWRPVRLVESMHASQYAMGLALREHVCPQDTIALIAAGAAAYLNDDHVIIDMLGLNDVHIAHSPPVVYKGRWDSGHVRMDVGYLLQRRPEWIQLDTHLFPSPHFLPRDWMPTQLLWQNPEIRRLYEVFPLRVEIPTDTPRPRVGYIFFLHRRDAPRCGGGE